MTVLSVFVLVLLSFSFGYTSAAAADIIFMMFTLILYANIRAAGYLILC